MRVEYREYQDSDYEFCESLVNSAWGFDTLFKSTNLQKIAKHLYTKGSLASSNYSIVAVSEGKVVGFIFGLNCNLRTLTLRKLIGGFLLVLKANLDLNLKRMDKAERKQFIDAIKNHHKNRLAADPRKMNEITLFVVSEAYQRIGIGKNLWTGFKEFCLQYGEDGIRVETNKSGASGFYEGLGFRHLINFNSPLHNLATPGGQACIYEYTHNKSNKLSQQDATSGVSA